MENKTVSIIAPIFNVENYAAKCIESLTAQSYAELEIILVNDGSTDSSGSICDEYAAADNRIKVIHKINGGLSSARNAGLDVASGEYIMFVDGDDYTDTCAVEELIGTIGESDIICYNWKKIYSDGRTKNCNLNPYVDGAVINGNSESLKQRLLCDDELGSVCTKLFRSSLISDLRFDESMIYVEDQIFCCEALSRAQSIKFADKYYYNYIMRDNGIIRSYNPKRFEFLSRFIDYLHIKAKDWRVPDDEATEAINSRTLRFAAAELYNAVFTYGLKRKGAIKIFKEITASEFFAKIDSSKLRGKKNKLIYFIAKHNMYTLLKAAYVLKRLF